MDAHLRHMDVKFWGVADVHGRRCNRSLALEYLIKKNLIVSSSLFI